MKNEQEKIKGRCKKKSIKENRIATLQVSYTHSQIKKRKPKT